MAVAAGAMLFKYRTNPPELRPWSRGRVVVSAVVGGTATVAVLGTLGWVAVFYPDWRMQLIAAVLMAFVVGFTIWVARLARRMHLRALEP
ncbi:hypothetical protein PWY87_34180 [Kribbella solani]|uniref:hypothetical protein n=1 Tax=Kribbella solani TaxID=236067 RepID=UPI0029A5079A|nr:hypothetical protein [Kribbella solani]MDX2972813.1 hypothetical protein [Kribbella solani]MDX3006766.1 hypothetical protein [Kribbella solani]